MIRKHFAYISDSGTFFPSMAAAAVDNVRNFIDVNCEQGADSLTIAHFMIEHRKHMIALLQEADVQL